MAHDVFLCHSAADKSIADAACAVLEGQNIRCWIAPRDIVPGSVWAASINRAIRQCRVLVLFYSAHSNGSPQVLRELELAVSVGAAILPLRLEDVAPAPAVEYYIGSAHWLNAPRPAVEPHLEALARAVHTLLGSSPQPAALEAQASAPPPAPPVPARRPPAGGEAPRPQWLVPTLAVGLLLGLGAALGVVLLSRAAGEGAGRTPTPVPGAQQDVVGAYEIHPTEMLDVFYRLCRDDLVEYEPGLTPTERRVAATERARELLAAAHADVRVNADGTFEAGGTIAGEEFREAGTWALSGGVMTITKTLEEGQVLETPVFYVGTYLGGVIRVRRGQDMTVELVLRRTR